jgi:hypothetical protein
MRELYTVISDIKKVIPETETSLIYDLEKIETSLRYTAPEGISTRWNECYYTIFNYIDKNNFSKDWEIQVISIFSGNSIEEIKKQRNN